MRNPINTGLYRSSPQREPITWYSRRFQNETVITKFYTIREIENKFLQKVKQTLEQFLSTKVRTNGLLRKPKIKSEKLFYLRKSSAIQIYLKIESVLEM